MAKQNKKAKLPTVVPVGEIYSFVKNGDTTIVDWLASQLPKGYTIVRTVIRHSSRVAMRHSLNVTVERTRDGRRVGISLDSFYNLNYLPSNYPRAIVKELKHRLKFLDYVEQANSSLSGFTVKFQVDDKDRQWVNKWLETAGNSNEKPKDSSSPSDNGIRTNDESGSPTAKSQSLS